MFFRFFQLIGDKDHILHIFANKKNVLKEFKVVDNGILKLFNDNILVAESVLEHFIGVLEWQANAYLIQIIPQAYIIIIIK